jgi:hypothetical protein
VFPPSSYIHPHTTAVGGDRINSLIVIPRRLKRGERKRRRRSERKI